MRLRTSKAGRAVGVALGVVGLVAGAITGLPAQPVPAASAAENSGLSSSVQSSEGPARSGLVPFGADMALLDPGAQYTLSPQLAGMLGRTTIGIEELTSLRTGLARSAAPALPGEPTPPVGTKLLWPAIDATQPAVLGIYLKQYELRGLGDKIEVWVASGVDGKSAGTAFPAGDCRNALSGATEVTTGQVNALVEEFDKNMYPKETKVFSTPPDRNGSKTIPGLTAAGLNFAGSGDRTITLVDNVRDPNFYEFPKNQTYVAGFFAPIFNILTDRNVMTIDAFDWAHRTGINPPDEPNKDLCKSRPGRPRAYEGVFAHEWQHLLQSYTDPGETVWLNEGLSDYAINLVGYGNTTRGVKQKRAESHLFCFQGFGTVKGASNANPRPCGGPQNSLTIWQDEGAGAEVLADYGNSWAFLLFLADRYGEKIITALHNDGQNQGLASVRKQLKKIAPKAKLGEVLHDYQLMNLLDQVASRPGADVAGIDADRIRTASLNSRLNLKNPAANSLPGVAPNGADYLLLRDAGGKAIAGKALKSLVFRGGATVNGADTSGDIVIPPPDPNAQVPVANWHFTLVGLDTRTNRVLVRTFKEAFDLELAAKALKAFDSYPTLVAVIAHDALEDVSAPVQIYAPYTFTVNGREAQDGS